MVLVELRLWEGELSAFGFILVFGICDVTGKVS